MFNNDEKLILFSIATQLITDKELKDKVTPERMTELGNMLEDFAENRTPRQQRELGLSAVYKLIDLVLAEDVVKEYNNAISVELNG